MRLDEIERSGNRGEWIPIGRALDIASFGVNAWSGEEGAELIPEHDEVPTGHEELYLVLDGHATFTVGGETIDAPAGTLVLARDPAVRRGAVAAAAGTTILSMGAKPGEAFRVSPWEVTSEVFPLQSPSGDSGRAEERRTSCAASSRPRSLRPTIKPLAVRGRRFPGGRMNRPGYAWSRARLPRRDRRLRRSVRRAPPPRARRRGL